MSGSGISGRINKSSLFKAILFTLALLTPVLAARAATAPETPCDPQFMQAMEARAWLEAQREITQNQNLIVKPDSVLEYSCFIGFLNQAAKNFDILGVKRQFSETNAWQTLGFSDTSTDIALQAVVSEALATYITANFPNDYLGGRLKTPTKIKGSDMKTVNGGAGYNCTLMKEIWENARCQNFNSIVGQDGFRDFFWYADPHNDPRKLPGAPFLACSAINKNLDTIYKEQLDEAFNRNQSMFVIPALDDHDPDGTAYKKDDVQTYFNLILPPTGRCADPIKTGVKIYRTGGGGGTDDAVCPNPGCSFVNGTCKQ